MRYLRTVIVTADIDEGFKHSAKRLTEAKRKTGALNLLASVRRHPLYILLRVRRELCF